MLEVGVLGDWSGDCAADMILEAPNHRGNLGVPSADRLDQGLQIPLLPIAALVRNGFQNYFPSASSRRL